MKQKVKCCNLYTNHNHKNNDFHTGFPNTAKLPLAMFYSTTESPVYTFQSTQTMIIMTLYRSFIGYFS